jgi:hypothetical protein
MLQTQVVLRLWHAAPMQRLAAQKQAAQMVVMQYAARKLKMLSCRCCLSRASNLKHDPNGAVVVAQQVLLVFGAEDLAAASMMLHQYLHASVPIVVG